MTTLPQAARDAAHEAIACRLGEPGWAQKLGKSPHELVDIALAAAEPHIRADERERCVAEIFTYTQTMSPIVGAAYRDAARVLVNRSVPPGGRRDN